MTTPDSVGFPGAVSPASIEPPAADPAPQEPLLSVGVVGTAAASVIGLLTAFAVPISPDQRVAILGVIAACLPLITAVVGRRRVFSPETVRLLLASHYDRGRAAGRKEITG